MADISIIPGNNKMAAMQGGYSGPSPPAVRSRNGSGPKATKSNINQDKLNVSEGGGRRNSIGGGEEYLKVGEKSKNIVRDDFLKVGGGSKKAKGGAKGTDDKSGKVSSQGGKLVNLLGLWASG